MSFVVAFLDDEKSAMACLVQIYGLFQAGKIIGKKTWKIYGNAKKPQSNLAKRVLSEPFFAAYFKKPVDTTAWRAC